MSVTRSPDRILREARLKAGLTQAELAERIGTTQSAVARLESPGANPRFETLERALLATGHGLDVKAVPKPQPVDETLIAKNLERTPDERLAAMQRHNQAIRRLQKAAGVK